MPDTGTNSLLAGLVQGYAGVRAQQAHQDLASRVDQRDNMLKYFGAMAQNPNVPPEHQQWAMEQVSALAQHDIGKPLPKGIGDLSKLPPVMLQRPPQQQVQTLPGMDASRQLAMPAPPGGATPQAQPSGDVGRAGNGTVNALGNVPPPGPIVPRTPLQMPTPPSSLISQGPTPEPEQIAPGGALHLLTPQDKLRYNQSLQQEEMNQLQQQFPNKSPEELAYFSQHGEFPKPDEFSLEPGQERFRDGKLIAKNEMPKPGTKSGFEPKMGPAGPIGITDVATGGMLTPQQVAANPQAKAVWDQAVTEHQKQVGEQEAKENRQHVFELNKLTQTFANALEMNNVNEAKKAAGEGRKAYNDLNKQYLADQQRYNAMSTLYDDIQRNPTGDVGSFDAALLAFHMGMTVGAVKGMRTGKDLIMFHEKARSLPEGMRTTFEGWIKGDQLSDEQRQNFVELAHEKMSQEKDQVEQAKGNYDTTFQEYQGRINEASRGRIKPKGTPGIQKPQQQPVGGNSGGIAPGTTAKHADGSRWRFKGGDSSDINNWEKI